MEVATHEVSVAGSPPPARCRAVEDILDDVLELDGPKRIGIVNVAVELLDAHVCERPVNTNYLKRIGRARPVTVEDQELILDAIRTLGHPIHRRCLLEALLQIKRGFGATPIRAFAS